MGYFFHFSSLYPAPYIELYMCYPIFSYLNFKAVLALPKTTRSAQTHKSICKLHLNCLEHSICISLAKEWISKLSDSKWTRTFNRIIACINYTDICSVEAVKFHTLCDNAYWNFQESVHCSSLFQLTAIFKEWA